ncbi:hypothetical protein GPJ56_010249 [Histomonas meleagridis]|uniref:uncharacterized protein n=1 Tax=Histomonas meleagridis TaxID=135588 RepID=UPI003559E044|nr:hypothetical protein GPJ56_010249 [Histomonas meleagridis]KAH0797117.1 hypothetical protein GO595_011010 [Histomonas meleagridis]
MSATPRILSDPSSESDSDNESGWDSTVLYIQPNQIWTKPAGAYLFISNASIVADPVNSSSAHAVLRACVDNKMATLCSLFPKRSSQTMRLIFQADQNTFLLNTGNFPISLCVLLKGVE